MVAMTTAKLFDISELRLYVDITGLAMAFALKIWDVKMMFWLEVKWSLFLAMVRAVFHTVPLLHYPLVQLGVTAGPQGFTLTTG